MTLADGLALPLGFAIFLFLTRRLGPAGYGLYTLAATLVIWVEVTIATLFERAVIKLAGESADWRPVGTAVLRLYLGAGTAAALLLVLLARPISLLLGEPSLASHLALFALDIPLCSLAYAHRGLLVGVGDFRGRARSTAARWVVKLLLVLVLVELGLSITGAIVGTILSSAAELVAARRGIRPRLWGSGGLPLRRFLDYALVLFLLAACLRIFSALDILLFKALGASASQAGVYGAAKNLALYPVLLGGALSSVLLSTLNRAVARGERDLAMKLARSSLRTFFWLLPVAALTAVAADEITDLLLGGGFGGAGRVLSILIVGAAAQHLLAICNAIQIAGGHARTALTLVAPMIPVSAAGYLLLVPGLGAAGAALSWAATLLLAAAASAGAVRRQWSILPHAGSVWRGLLTAAVVAAAAAWWPAAGWWRAVKLVTLGGAVPLLLLILGEFSPTDMAVFRGALKGRRREGDPGRGPRDGFRPGSV
jgi:O-antigen/teichoic acid export membrane protein